MQNYGKIMLSKTIKKQIIIFHKIWVGKSQMINSLWPGGDLDHIQIKWVSVESNFVNMCVKW